ncbi:DUF2520 domain-containing protein [Natroniella acetigena]|uniref:Rossmann-like and DUF2520 domain-containing protein n=1 Tax=Natroniella acetigena TaxID=52004 RepID=UPI00200A85E3|nr:Rossmann-like and DUF2520 domain-containing protein [Natroniella acetigena]MCK8827500.1 DUF2520 domain-containing protein [Natroniella acetigena]
MVGKKVVIIGAGRVGQSFGYLLKQQGYQILGFISRSLSSAQAGVELIGQGVATTEYEEFILEADLVVISTPDRMIAEVSKQLFESDLVSEGSCLVHLSGALTSEILAKEDEDQEYGRLSLHPLQSVADVESGITNLPQAFFTIEGEQLGVEVGEEILTKLGVDYEIISQQAKPFYHAAACVASNYLVAIVNLALEMNQNVGISKEQAVRALLPLIKGSINNIENLGPIAALTGPISRGDNSTIEEHLEAFEEFSSERSELYRKLGSYTVEIAEQKGSITEADKVELIKILEEENSNDCEEDY